MNLRQIEYIVAVERYRHFATAAEKCFVTQPTLSMMINKAEEELGIKIFDRSKFPVEITPIGLKIIEQAKLVLYASAGFKEIIDGENEKITREVVIGILPSLASYIIPVILPEIMAQYPALKVRIIEAGEENMVKALKSNEVEMGLMSWQGTDEQLNDIAIFHEKFYLYISEKEELAQKDIILYRDLDMSRLWLIEDVYYALNYNKHFDIRKKSSMMDRLWIFETGTFQTLIGLVNSYGGMTLIPELLGNSLKLAGNGLKSCPAIIKSFDIPPEWKISIVTNKQYSRNKIIESLTKLIKERLNANASRRDVAGKAISSMKNKIAITPEAYIEHPLLRDYKGTS